MNNFSIHNPTKINFGVGCVCSMASEITTLGKKALLVYGGGSVHKNNSYKDVVGQLNNAGITFIEFAGVSGNPKLSHTNEGIALARKESVDFIVALGGGSVVDEAKAIAAGVCYEGDVWDLFAQRARPTKALPLVAVLTLPATASEMNGISVITHDETKDKLALIASPLLNPKISYMDPSYTTTVSLKQTGFAAADIISHATEGYFVTTAKELYPQDELIEGIVRSVRSAMKVLTSDPTNIEARSALMWSATIAWNGLLQAGIPGMGTPCHAIEMPLSAVYDVAHGGGLSIVTPIWMRKMSDRYGDRIKRFGKRVLDVNGSVEDVSRAMEALYKEMGSPIKLSDVGVTSIDIPYLVKLAFEALKMRKVTGYSEQLLTEIFEEAL